MHEKFLIIGIPPGGLFLARQLRKQYPSSLIFAVGDSCHDIGRYSNTLNRFYGISPGDDMLVILQKVYNDLGKGRVEAFICSNPMLEAIIELYPEVFEFLVFENSIDVYKSIINKKVSFEICDLLNIKRPKEYPLVNIQKEQISFPFVIKPLMKAATSGVSKCAFIRTEKDYSLYLSKLSNLGIDKSHLICQQLVEGNNKWEYGYGGYFNEGKPLIDICFHQFMQVPQGLCCYSREMTDPILEIKIRNLIQPFMDYTHYCGMIEFDVKQDSESTELYLLDINPRPWRSSDMLAAKLGNSTIFNPKPTNKKVVWRYPYRELFAGKNPLNVSHSLCKSMTKGYRTKTHYTLLDRNDKLPFLMQMKEDVCDLFKRIKQ